MTTPTLWPSEAPSVPVREAGDCALLWRGAGALAFAGSSASGPVDSSPLRRALEGYRRWGGRGCLVLDDSRFAGPGGAWIGEDGGPGRSAGVHALAFVEEVGTICVPSEISPALLRGIEELAHRRPDLEFFVGEPPRDGSSGEASRLRFPCPNVAVLARLPGDDFDVPTELGHLGAYLETRDFRLEPPFRSRITEPPPWLQERESLWLQAWRRHQGLWRSLDIGTRWVLFELDHPRLWGRVEREVLGFLRGLELRGFLSSGAEDSVPWVRCGSRSSTRGGGDRVAVPGELRIPVDAPGSRSGGDDPGGADPTAPLVIRVGARLAAPYAAALAGLLEAAEDAGKRIEPGSGAAFDADVPSNGPRTSGDDEPGKGEDIDGQ